MKQAPPRISRRIRNRTPPTAPPTIVPRLLSDKEASVGEVNGDFRRSTVVPGLEVPWRRDAVVLGAGVVGGGSAEREREREHAMKRYKQR